MKNPEVCPYCFRDCGYVVADPINGVRSHVRCSSCGYTSVSDEYSESIDFVISRHNQVYHDIRLSMIMRSLTDKELRAIIASAKKMQDLDMFGGGIIENFVEKVLEIREIEND